jgi:hypothetical protein
MAMNIQDQMKERLAGYCGFLRQLAKKNGIDDLDGEQLERLAEFLTPETPADVDEDAVGLNRWSMRDWAKRPRQTGMEQQNEKTVLELLNLFTGLDIPFYIRDQRGEKTGREYSTPERLAMLKEQFFEMRKVAKEATKLVNEADQRADAAKKTLADYELALHAAVNELHENPHHEQAVGRVKVILENVVHDRASSVKISDPDDSGVRHVTLDAREVMLRLCFQRIVHDLAPDERICKQCLGLGIFKVSAPYGMGKQKPHKEAFPFQHQWLSPCHHCYMGKVRVCLHCKEDLSRLRTRCECKAAQAERMAEEAIKEAERRKAVPRIALADYTHPMVWCDKTDKFIQVDHLEDHLEDHPDAVVFACEPTESLTKPDAEDVIETLQDRATGEASPEDGEDVLDFSKEATTELATFLEEWSKKHVVARTLYYPDMNLIVEVPRGDATDAVPDVRADDGAGEGAPAGAEDLPGGDAPGDDAPA